MGEGGRGRDKVTLVDVMAADREMRCSYNRAAITSYNLASRPRRGNAPLSISDRLSSSTMKLGTATRVVVPR
jgi:hypothetical protein